MPRVAVVFLGGTISSVVDPVAGGNVPTLDGAAILAGPRSRRDRGGRGGRPRADPGQPLHDLAARGDRRSHRGAAGDPAVDGVVVVQGTDTVEETAFCWDLLLDGEKPSW